MSNQYLKVNIFIINKILLKSLKISKFKKQNDFTFAMDLSDHFHIVR